MHERTLNVRTIYEGKVVTLRVLEVETETGQRTAREVVSHSGAVAVLAKHPDGRYIFVRQFRKPVEQVMTEVVAGLLEEGEDPVQCARRELEEETGYRARTMEHVGSVYPSPGYVTERIHIFFAEAAEGPGGARPDPDERVEVKLLTAQEVEDQIRRGEIQDGKTLAAWLLCVRMRPEGG